MEGPLTRSGPLADQPEKSMLGEKVGQSLDERVVGYLVERHPPRFRRVITGFRFRAFVKHGNEEIMDDVVVFLGNSLDPADKTFGDDLEAGFFKDFAGYGRHQRFADLHSPARNRPLPLSSTPAPPNEK